MGHAGPRPLLGHGEEPHLSSFPGIISTLKLGHKRDGEQVPVLWLEQDSRSLVLLTCGLLMVRPVSKCQGGNQRNLHPLCRRTEWLLLPLSSFPRQADVQAIYKSSLLPLAPGCSRKQSSTGGSQQKGCRQLQQSSDAPRDV